ncbi:MAG TPA: DUF3347 domain-containing protein [Puia sp.]|jgi:hypothetical protein
MEKKFLMGMSFVLAFVFSGLSQTGTSLSPLLRYYYGVKDALVAGDAKTAAMQAGELVKSVNAVDKGTLAPAERTAFTSVQEKLAFDARHISEVTDIGHQREHFTTLSGNMAALAKAVPLSDQPVYEEYCPMKKAYWLSSETVIKNPYFGSMMLTCGKVTATMKH